MAAGLRVLMSVGVGLAALAAASGAQAGGCSQCKAPPPPSNCGCKVPNGHNVYMPPLNVTVSASAVAVASASASAQSSSAANAFANSAAFANRAVFNGGGSNWYVEQGSTGVIPNLQVEGVEGGEARRICTAFQSAEKLVAIQAECLDDKLVPHPASQVMPDRDVGSSYEGEVYRCIAGARMQYTLGAFAGVASFDHGQTITCDKGQALYHSAGGRLECRAQKPARDCNERSLLRRYGAGIILM